MYNARMKSFHTPVLLIVVGAAIGFFGCALFKGRLVGNRAAFNNDSQTEVRDDQKKRELLNLFKENTDILQRKQMLTALIMALSKQEIEAALEYTKTLSKEDYRQAVAALLDGLFERDPLAALNYTTRLHVRIREPNLKRLLTMWTERDYSSAETWASKQPLGSRQREAVFIVAQVGAKSDPKHAFDLLKLQNLSPGQLTIIQDMLENWARHDLAEAARYVFAVKNYSIRNALLQGLLVSQEGAPPRDAIEWISKFPDAKTRDTAIEYVIKNWMDKDPQSAYDYTFGLEISKLRTDLLCRELKLIAETYLQAAIVNYRQLESEIDRNMLIEALVHGSIIKNRSETLAFAQSLPEGEARNKALRAASETLARQDLAAAKEILQMIPQGSERRKAVNKIAKEMETMDIPGALDFRMAELGPNVLVDGPTQELIKKWVKADSTAARKWLQNLPDSNFKSGLTALSVDSSIVRPGVESFEIAKTFDPKTYSVAAKSIAFEWAQLDFEAATDWVQKMPQGDAKDNAARGVASALIPRRTSELDPWLNKLNGSTVDAALQSVSLAFAGENRSVDGMQYASRITDRTLKFQIANALVSDWANKDKNAAVDWVQKTGLFDESMKQKLLQAAATK